MSSLIQGSKEWLEFRRIRVGSSDSPAIMGVSRYKTAYELYMEKKNPTFENIANDAMREGTRKEPIARKWYGELIDEVFSPVVAVHPIYPLIHSSIDGVTFDWDELIEIKCPGIKAFEDIKKNGIPDDYFCQCQHHMLVTDLEEVTFIAYVNDKTFHIIKVQRDDKYILELLDKILAFLDCLQNNTPPEQTKRKTKVDYEETNDAEILSKISIIRAAKKRMAVEEALIDAARSELEQLSAGRNLRGDGFQLYRTTTAGAVDYSKIPELKNVDLEVYRKPSYQKFTIKVDDV